MSSKHTQHITPGINLESITKMSHEEQVELLSDALLREYMHRRGFRGTLKTFDQEHPRDEHTISSRVLMSELMWLQSSDQQRLRADNIETIMEMLCALRIERRLRVEELQAKAAEPLPVLSKEDQELLNNKKQLNTTPHMLNKEQTSCTKMQTLQSKKFGKQHKFINKSTRHNIKKLAQHSLEEQDEEHLESLSSSSSSLSSSSSPEETLNEEKEYETTSEEEEEEEEEREVNNEDEWEQDDDAYHETGTDSMTIDDLLDTNNEDKINNKGEVKHNETMRKAKEKKSSVNTNNRKAIRKEDEIDELLPTPPKSNLSSVNTHHLSQLVTKKKLNKASTKVKKQHTNNFNNNNSRKTMGKFFDDTENENDDVISEVKSVPRNLNSSDDDEINDDDSDEYEYDDNDEYDEESEEEEEDDENDRECKKDGGDEIGHEELQKVFQALFGIKTSSKHYLLPYLCHQGFVFDNIIEYALVQLEQEEQEEEELLEEEQQRQRSKDNGSTNVHLSLILTAIQAFVTAYYFERNVYTETSIRQRDCLHRAIVTILIAAQPDVRKVVLVSGKLPEKHSDKRSRVFSSISRMHAYVNNHFYEWREFVSASELERQLSVLINKYWMQEDGCGVWCFLLSLIMSRGGTSIMHDFKQSLLSASSSLNSPQIHNHSTAFRRSPSLAQAVSLLELHKNSPGHRALLNLMLYGKACVFDVDNNTIISSASARNDGTTSKNKWSLQNIYRHPLTCGLLIGYKLKQHEQVKNNSNDNNNNNDNNDVNSSSYNKNTNKYMSDSDIIHATHPVYPSWIICYNGHCANLYLKGDVRKTVMQKRTLSGTASIELFYWDVATMDDEIHLTLTLKQNSSQPLHTTQLRNMSNIASAYSTSFVNRAIATVSEWNGAEVNWHGVTPLKEVELIDRVK